MPRKAAVEIPEKSEFPGLSDAAFELGKRIGNVPMADAILRTDDGEFPEDDELTGAMLVSVSAQKTAALRKWMRLNSSIGKQLSEAYKDYQTWGDRERRIFAELANPSEKTNGVA